MKTKSVMLALLLVPATAMAEHECFFSQMTCGQTVNGSISGFECDLGGGQYTDIWRFPGIAGQAVTIDIHGIDIDPLGALLDARPELRASDDDSGQGLDSRITFTLDRTESWGIGVLNAVPFDFGSYTITLQCSNVGPAPACTSTDTALCLGTDARFRVEATFLTGTGASGQARVVKLTSATGYLWFFNDTNVEAVIKVLDACVLNQRFWVFAGGLTDVNVVITVTDTKTGAVKTYTNPQGKAFQPVQDTSAFATCP